MAGRVCVCAVFNKRGVPLAAGVLDDSGGKQVYPMYGRGAKTTIYDAERGATAIADAINNAVAAGVDVVTTNFKSILDVFRIQRVRGVDYPVYDLCWDTMAHTDEVSSALAAIPKLLDRLACAKTKRWQKIFANAAIVYQDLQERGVLIGMMRRHPVWSQDTYSGRSKNRVVNIQGADGVPGMTNPDGAEDDLHVHFDMVAADMRVASLMSGDSALQETFVSSDPYSALSEMLTTGSGAINRDDCKIQLLQAVNSFNFDHPVLREIFVDLGVWLKDSKTKLDVDGHLSSIVGRRFTIEKARNRNPLAVMNGVLQGSVASGMQSSIKRIWDTFGTQLLVETHDSVVVTCRSDYLQSVIDGVVAIMTRPLAGLVNGDPFFPVRVSVGKRFREWSPVAVYRESGVSYIEHDDAEAEQGPEEEEEGTPEETVDSAA